MKRFTSPAFQAFYASADDHWVVWMEASLQPSFEDWSIFAYDRSEGTAHLVATAFRDSSGHPVPTPNVAPKVDHGVIVWSAGTAEQPLGSHIKVFMAAAAKGPVQVLASDAIYPVISWPYVAYNHFVPTTESGNTELTVVDLRSRERRVVSDVVSPDYALHANTLIWIDRSHQNVHLRDLTTDEDLILTSSRHLLTDYVQFPSISDRLVVWAAQEGTWAYDLDLGVRLRLTTFEHPGMGSGSVAGDWLWWWDPLMANTAGRDNFVDRLVDIRTVPCCGARSP